MKTTDWLRKQVERLEAEIRSSTIFDSADVPSSSELADLRTNVVLHTYLRQQLLRRETIREVPEEEYDTQEFVVVRRSSGQ
jgi:hypothetical protein